VGLGPSLGRPATFRLNLDEQCKQKATPTIEATPRNYEAFLYETVRIG